jgi:hypothetical protein
MLGLHTFWTLSQGQIKKRQIIFQLLHTACIIKPVGKRPNGFIIKDDNLIFLRCSTLVILVLDRREHFLKVEENTCFQNALGYSWRCNSRS